jgi:hypothetical protein
MYFFTMVLGTRRRATALTALLFFTGISVSSNYENCGVRHFLRTDTTFDIVQHTYIHGGLSLNREGTSVAPPTRRTVQRTHTNAGPARPSRRAHSGAPLIVRRRHARLERERVEDILARPAAARRSARRPRSRRSSRRSPCPRGKARHEPSVHAARWGIPGERCGGERQRT